MLSTRGTILGQLVVVSGVALSLLYLFTLRESPDLITSISGSSLKSKAGLLDNIANSTLGVCLDLYGITFFEKLG